MKKSLLSLLVILSVYLSNAQTVLAPGDIAFLGVNTDGATDADDNFAFILLKDIDAATQIIFTDRGWNDGTGFFEAVGDGDFTWTASTALSAGEVVVLDFSNLQPLAASFTVLGDQLFAIQGSLSSPTFIAGLHFNVLTGITDDANWDGAATSNTTSALPDALTNGDTAIRLSGPGGIEQDNFQFSCATATCPLAGTPEEIRTIVHNLSNWVSKNDTPFSGTVDTNFGTPTVTDCVATLTASETEVCLSFNPPTSIDLSGNSTPDPTGTGSFSFGAGSDTPAAPALVDNNDGTGTFDPIAAGAGTYIMVYTHTNSTGCVAVAQETIVVYPEVNISITGSSSVSEDAAPVNFQGLLGGTSTSGVLAMSPTPPNGSYVGSAPNATGQYTPAIGDAGNYTITFTYVDTDNNNCINQVSIPFTVEELPPFIVINEIMQNPSAVADSAGEWFELYNAETTDIDINGWTIKDNDADSHVINNGGALIIPAGGYLILGNNADTGTNGGVALDYQYTGLFLANGDDEIVLLDGSGKVIDHIEYDGGPNFPDPTGASMALKNPTNDNNVGSNWETSKNPFGSGDLGTPGLSNDTPADITPPVITCPGDIIISNDLGQCGAMVNFTATATDDSSFTIAYNIDPGSFFSVGTTTITATATDVAGNQSVCNFNVTVNDTEPSAIECKPLFAELDSDGKFEISANFLFNNAFSSRTDNCGTNNGNINVTGPLIYDCSNIGENSITLFVFDVNGNQSSCKTTITITDPLNTCPEPCSVVLDSQPQDITVFEGDSDSFSVTASGTGILSYDWQLSNDQGVTWTSFAPEINGGTTLHLARIDLIENGNQYKVKVTSDNGTPGNDKDDCFIISDVATLNVNPLSKVIVTKDVIGIGSNPDAQFYFFYNTSIPNEYGNFYLSESGINSPEQEGGSFSYAGTFLIQIREENLPDKYSISDIQFNSEKGTSTIRLKTQNEIQIDVASGDNVSIKFINEYTEPCSVEIDTQPVSATICAGDPLSFDVGATGTGTLSYQWQVDTGNGFENLGGPSFNSLLSFASMEIGGDGYQYKVIVTSDNGTPNVDTDDCSVTSEVARLTVNPAPIVQISGNESYCHNGDGVVLDAGAGFTSYLWSPGGETTQSITAMAGNYSVQVTNEFGCGAISEVFMVTNNQQLVCSIEQEKLATNHITEDGVATVYATGGTGQFTFLWDNGETTQTANSLTYGLHNVTVTDSNGCETSCQIDIAKELYCWVNLIQNVSVVGGNDGAAQVKGNGGYRPYTFKWEDGSIAEVNSSLTVGTHYVSITDATGATSQCSVTIAEPTKEKCNDFVSTIEQDELATNHITEDGVATIYATGGTGKLTYLWDNGETSQTATRLTYGLHSVTVTDAKGCETTSQIDIAKELYCWTYLINNVSEYGANDGAAGVRGNGGYRPYTFKWDDGSTEEVNYSLSAGSHYVTITDATGATSRCGITITEPNQEVCDGVDNDGDGDIDEGFDQDGDGIADCFDKCAKGDDSVDIDNDGIPDACDDNVCIKSDEPVTECYQTAEWNEQTCSWDIVGEKPMEPVTECYETAVWNGQTCSWDIVDGQPEKPVTECYQTAEWNEQTCSWDIVGEKPMEPVTECYETAVWNGATCSWDIVDGQPEKPETECYQTAEWNDQTCSWDIVGEKPMEPVTECYETAVWNGVTCSWDIVDGQPEKPETECYQTAEWNDQTCSWDIVGEKPMEPVTECYETAIWNSQTCSWDKVDGQPEKPVTECYQTAEWNEQTCSWDIVGEKPMEPVTECYEIAVWNEQTCRWDIEGEQPEMPVTECNETAVWNEITCDWEIIENDNDCGTGTIDQCETAFARSSDVNVRTCLLDIANVSGNRWGWTNEFPSINGTYQMDVYAAAGQCDISKGALVGNVEIIYTDGKIDVTVSTLSAYEMTDAQLHVGTKVLPTQGNGFTAAPGQYPYPDMANGAFNTYTFEDIYTGDMDSFYVVLHANVCPIESLTVKRPVAKLELNAYPIPFNENLNLEIVSPMNMIGTLSLYNGIGQKVQGFGTFNLKQGDNEINLNIGELPIGMYFIRMTSIYGNESLKVIRK
ncbi:lamin tail domain-containing protein [Maribacter sp. CXY002]|uniref:lamin tail domain-containing protein n=1 Tax=Maribacter luteocoastalis TaxID=3407671 RepID=UPI003B6794C5